MLKFCSPNYPAHRSLGLSADDEQRKKQFLPTRRDNWKPKQSAFLFLRKTKKTGKNKRNSGRN